MDDPGGGLLPLSQTILAAEQEDVWAKKVRLQREALQEMRREMTVAGRLCDLLWRILAPRHYARWHYVHVSIDVPIVPSETLRIMLKAEDSPIIDAPH
jgi:hypothetical protein